MVSSNSRQARESRSSNHEVPGSEAEDRLKTDTRVPRNQRLEFAEGGHGRGRENEVRDYCTILRDDPHTR